MTYSSSKLSQHSIIVATLNRPELLQNCRTCALSARHLGSRGATRAEISYAQAEKSIWKSLDIFWKSCRNQLKGNQKSGVSRGPRK